MGETLIVEELDQKGEKKEMNTSLEKHQNKLKKEKKGQKSMMMIQTNFKEEEEEEEDGDIEFINSQAMKKEEE